MCIIKLFLFFLWVNLVVSFGTRSSNLNMTLTNEHLTTIYPENSPFKLDIRRSQFNRTSKVFDLNVTIADNIDHRYYIEIEIQLWGDGGWKRNALNYNNYDPCKQLKMMFGPKYTDLLVEIGLGKQCPYRPGFYHFRNAIDLGVRSWAIYYGRTRFIAKIYKHRKELVLTFECISIGSEFAELK